MSSIFDDPTCLPGIGLDPRFAGLIRLSALGYRGKRIETRGTATRLRGPFVVCSTSGERTKDDPDLARCFERARAELVPELIPAEVFDRETSIRSAAVALGTVTGCRPLTAENWPAALFSPPAGKTRFAWPLSNLWPIDPFVVRPAPGFFRVSKSSVAAGIARWVMSVTLPSFRLDREDPNALVALLSAHIEALREHDVIGFGPRWSSC